MWRSSALLAATLVACVAPSVARANPEPPAMYDSRVVGIGGNAVAFIDSPAALYHNPAGLGHIETFETTAVLTNLLVNFYAPFAGEGSEQESGINYAPLAFLGGAGRVHDRVVVGLGVYISTGFGGGFQDVSRIGIGEGCLDDGGTDLCLDPPEDQTVFLVVGELAVPVSVEILDNLRFGLTLRMPYARQEVDASQEIFPGKWAQANQSLSGFGVPGVLLGLQYEPIDGLMLGFAYRSKLWIDMEGSTRSALPADGRFPYPMGTELNIPTTTRWSVPHMIRFGLAGRLLQQRLLLSAEFKIQMHHEANREQVFELHDDDIFTPDDISIPFRWRNVYLTSGGAELMATDRFPVRAGFSIGRGATPRSTVNPFTPPPGLLWAIYGGFGYAFDSLDVDFGFSWGTGAPAVVEESGELCATDQRSKGGCAGTYQIDSYFISVSATYRL